MIDARMRLYELFRKQFNLSENETQEAMIVVEELVREKQQELLNHIVTPEFLCCELAWVKDEVHKLGIHQDENLYQLLRVIYWTSMMQFLAIAVAMGSVVIFVAGSR